MKIDYKRHVTLALVIILVVVAIIYLELQKSTPEVDYDKKVDESIQMLNSNNTNITTELNVEKELTIQKKERIRNPEKEKNYTFAPEFTGINNWIGTEPLEIGDLQGKVVLIDFWTYSCINCIRTLPYITAWDKKYRDDGLVIIGVHTPEFFFEEKTENVVAAMQKYGIEFAVAQDNDKKTWKAYQNRYWPRKYLIDKEGYIRYDHIGEGAYEETEMQIQELLAETGSDISEELVSLEEKTPNTKNTPELYAGYDYALKRNQNIGNEEGLQADKEIYFTLPSELKRDVIYVTGMWKSNADNLQAISDGAIVINYAAKSVNIVASSEEISEMNVFVNDSALTKNELGEDTILSDAKSIIKINEPRLYNIYSGDYGRKILRLEVKKGFKFNAFTFG